ncbi:DUF7346 family protein [Halorarius litoreus]|uniref:DUF7346 family protein n=1 Tax=Halorarius litoreus TaxID=2962676 RepID=UPI0020CD66E1|nr:hypothetical protein [Halorarius litoreus]
MRTVETDDGTRYLLVKQSSESSRVRDPTTGEEQYLPNADLTVVDAGPLETAAAAVPEATRTLLTATHDERALGLLLELRRRGPVPVRSLLGDYDLCESDLLGILTEFRVAGLVEEADAAGERGYRLTEQGETALAPLLD